MNSYERIAHAFVKRYLLERPANISNQRCIIHCHSTTMPRAKAPSFNVYEKDVFLDILKKYRDVIEDKTNNAKLLALKEEAWGKVTEEFSSRYLHVNYRVLSFNETIPTCQISLQCISTPTSGDLPRRATKEGALPVATHRVPASTGSIPEHG